LEYLYLPLQTRRIVSRSGQLDQNNRSCICSSDQPKCAVCCPLFAPRAEQVSLLLCQWISHRNHRGNLCGVDFIWLLNPSSQLAPLTADWKAAIFGMIKAKLHKKGLEERDAFNFFQAGGEGKDKDVVTLQDFHMAMDQVRVLVMGFLWLFLVSSVVFCVSLDLSVSSVVFCVFDFPCG
jgi:hypothetical protein